MDFRFEYHICISSKQQIVWNSVEQTEAAARLESQGN